MNYLIGILGGMGPAATVDFMGKVVALSEAQCDQEHLPLLAASIPNIPDRSAHLLKQAVSPLPELKRYLRLLEDAGAQCIVMPCNTAHYWFADLQAVARVDTLSIIDAVADEVKAAGFTKVGLLATNATLATQLYQKKLQEYGIVCETPTPAGQEKVMASIYALKAGDLAQAQQAIDPEYKALLDRGVDAVILGCTEIPVILASRMAENPSHFVDSNAALARATIRWYEAKTGRAVLKTAR